jgi:hypothetical protein
MSMRFLFFSMLSTLSSAFLYQELKTGEQRAYEEEKPVLVDTEVHRA